MADAWGPVVIHGYTLSGKEYEDGSCWGECESGDGRHIYSCRGPYRQAIIDRLTAVAFRDWRRPGGECS